MVNWMREMLDAFLRKVVVAPAFKKVLIHLLLKIATIDLEKLNNYCIDSNVPFLSKVM